MAIGAVGLRVWRRAGANNVSAIADSVVVAAFVSNAEPNQALGTSASTTPEARFELQPAVGYYAIPP